MTLLLALIACKPDPEPLGPAGTPATPEPRPPLLRVDFPTEGRIDASRVSFRGVVLDGDGVSRVWVTHIGTGEVTKAIVDDSQWSVPQVPVGEHGPIEFLVQAEDTTGLISESTVRFERGPIVQGPFLALSMDPISNEVFVNAWQTLYRFDRFAEAVEPVAALPGFVNSLASHDGLVYYAAGNAVRQLDTTSGIDTERMSAQAPPRGLAVTATGVLYMVNEEALWRLSPGEAPMALILFEPGPGRPNGLAVVPEDGLAYVLMVDHPEDVLEVDLDTGAVVSVSGESRGGGPRPVQAASLALDATESRLLIADHATGDLLGVDRVTGVRFVLTPAEGPPGAEALEGTRAVAVRNAERLVLDSHTPTLASISNIGGYTPVGPGGFGEGTGLVGPEAVVWDEGGNRVLVADVPPFLGPQSAAGRVIAVDPRDGERVEISGPTVGAGPALGVPAAVALDPSGDRASVLSVNGRVFDVDLQSGDRTLVYNGELFESSYRMAGVVDTGSTVFIGAVSLDDVTQGRVLAVDVASGTGTFVEQVGGPLAFDPDENRLFIGAGAFIEVVNLSSGERESYLAGSEVRSLSFRDGEVWSLTVNGRLAAQDSPSPRIEIDWDVGTAKSLSVGRRGLLYGVGLSGVVVTDGTTGEWLLVSR